MMEYDVKRSGQIPKFGNWDYSDDLPITEYFECARQAGLIPPPSSSDDLCPCGPCVKARRPYYTEHYADAAATAAADYRKAPLRKIAVPTKKKFQTENEGRNKNRRPPQVKEQRKQVRVGNDVKEKQPRNQVLSMKQQLSKQQPPDHILMHPPAPPLPNLINAKPVDEDLYHIPPHLLHNSKRKKMLGFFTRCLVPPCSA